MAQSQTTIVNLALSHLGQGPINDINDSSANGREASRLARLHWDVAVDSVLVELPWNFAVKRASAQKLDVAPAWQYAYAYPPDPLCLRVLEVEGDIWQAWEIEEVADRNCIVTDLGPPINYRFIKRVADVSRWSPGFGQALAARLALEWAEALTRDQSVVRNMVELYNAKLKLARQVDSQEKTPVQIDASTWVEARRSGIVQLARLDGDPQPLGFPT